MRPTDHPTKLLSLRLAALTRLVVALPRDTLVAAVAALEAVQESLESAVLSAIIQLCINCRVSCIRIEGLLVVAARLPTTIDFATVTGIQEQVSEADEALQGLVADLDEAQGALADWNDEVRSKTLAKVTKLLAGAKDAAERAQVRASAELGKLDDLAADLEEPATEEEADDPTMTTMAVPVAMVPAVRKVLSAEAQ